MRISPVRRGLLDLQADRIEKVLSSLSLPARIQGGQVGADHVRYHLAPLSDTQIRQVRKAAPKVAEAMGVYRVRIDEMEEGLVIDLPIREKGVLYFLPLMEDLGDLLPLTAVIGISTNGRPLLINFRRQKTWHLFAYGPSGIGKSELLRTILLSLALSNRQSQVQFLGIDASGKELTVIEALPHALSEVAVDLDYAEEIILWLGEEMRRRALRKEMYPDILLLIDGLEGIIAYSDLVQKELPYILHEGPNTGVHLLLTNNEARPISLVPNWHKTGVVVARPGGDPKRIGDAGGQRGQFEFQVGGERMEGQVAWLPAHDLHKAVKMVQSGWHVKGPVDLNRIWV
jgi:hypothetical protein